MKKALSVLLCVCLALGCLPFAALAAAIGDTNASGDVTAEDARAILRAAVGLDELTGEALLAADVNTDGEVTAEDARLALRTAVGLELAAPQVFENQYDILRSGFFCAELDGGADVGMTLAARGDDQWILTSMDGIDFSVLVREDSVYLLDAPHRVYAAFDAAATEFLGEDALDMNDIMQEARSFADFSALPPLDDAAFTQEAPIDGVPTTAYLFPDADGYIKINMDGPRIRAFSRIDSRGRTLETLRFASVRAVLPAEPFSAPETYLQIPDLMTYMLIAFAGALGVEGITEADIQEMIEEAKQAA